MDYNYLILEDKNGKKIFRKILYSKAFLTFLLIFFQIALFVFFLLKLTPYTKYYLLSSILLSASFILFLTNTKGKNEFKFAWLLPTIIFPLFGISAYIIYHTNIFGIKRKQKLKKLKERSEIYYPENKTALKTIEKYPEYKNLFYYLLSEGRFFPHEKCKTEYYPTGEDFYPEFYKALKKAKNYIFLEYFIIDIDESWSLILEILAEKVLEGVEVRVMFDGIGSISASQSRYVNYLKSRGIKAQVFEPLIPIFATNQNNRDHRKIAIIDGKVAFTGGLNISNEYFNYKENRFPYWKDNAIKIEGKAITNLIIMFLQNWNLFSKTSEGFGEYLNIKYSNYKTNGLIIPYGDDAANNEDIAENVYLHLINNAKDYINITSPYLIIDNDIEQALIFAAKRNVKVNIILPNIADHYFPFCLGKTYIKNLLLNRINIYYYEKGFIHQKTFLIDDEIATVGSINLDYRSLYHHYECGVVLYKTETIEKIREDFENIFSESRLLGKNDYKKIPFIQRFIGKILRIFSPLL